MTGNHETARAILAREIRCAREAKGMSRAALAKAVLVSDSLVAAWESGRQPVKPEHLRRLFEVLPLGPDTIVRVLDGIVSNEVAPEWMGKWLEIERQATSFLEYQPLLVPGLLQVESYIREVIITSGRPMTEAVVQEQVRARQVRQKILAQDELAFMAVMDEGVLRRQVGEERTMRDQFARSAATSSNASRTWRSSSGYGRPSAPRHSPASSPSS
jgi:transcriptional regulator with XRE-family HTH domain